MTLYRTSGWLASALLLLAACQRHAVPTTTTAPLPVETGVSQTLAEARKQLLSEVAYALTLTIPAQKASPIAGTEVVTFKLKDNRQPLQLDFKASADHLGSVAVNGRPVPLDYQHEHLK